MLRYLSAFLY